MIGLTAGSAVLVFLREPKERIWGLLESLDSAGVVLRGLELQSFEDWLRQEARGEDAGLGLATVFYPMHRVERVEADETVGLLPSCAERFFRAVGRTVFEAAGIEVPSRRRQRSR